MCSDTNCWGIPAPPCADRGCTDSCSSEGKAHWHNILRGSAKPPTSTGESPYYLEIEKGYNKYMEEDHSTPSSHTLLPMAAAPLSLFFSSRSHTLSFYLSKHSHIICLLYRHQVLSISSTWRDQSSHNTWHELCRNSCFHLAFH